MTRRIGFVMDPLEFITPKKDSTLAMMLSARDLGWELLEIHVADLALERGAVHARMRRVEVHDDDADWFRVRETIDAPLGELDAILMRKDPPFDMDYVYATYLLEQAEQAGLPVINRPRALRDFNEKLATAWFPDLCPPTLVTANRERLRSFIAEHGDSIVKPLDGMGGTGVFRLSASDSNIGSALEMLTGRYRHPIMAQQYLPAITEGDKRILLVDGQPLEYCLARLAGAGETRANLAAGGSYRAQPLSEADRRISERVGPMLLDNGLRFVGLDVIGDRLTEINVTSPTCIREIARDAGVNAAERLMAVIAASLDA
jgi:glutathione synthase